MSIPLYTHNIKTVYLILAMFKGKKDSIINLNKTKTMRLNINGKYCTFS